MSAIERWAWLALDGDRPWGVGATRADAEQMLDELLTNLSSATITDDWYEPSLPSYRDGTRFMRWYNLSPIPKDICQEVRRYPLHANQTTQGEVA